MAIDRLNDPTVYGGRAKLGVIVPPTNTANEAEWNRMAPQGVSIHSARMPLHMDTESESGRRALHDDLRRHAADLAQASVDVIAYGCTAGSMTVPASGLADFMQSASGRTSITTAQSLVEALRALGAKRVAVATPYHDALNNHEKHFLEGHGFAVVALRGLGYGANGPAEYRNIARIPPAEVLVHARSVVRDDADTVLLSCTDMATLDIIEPLERDTGKPVVSSNQATFWYALRRAGIADRLTGYGRLLAEH
jgi:maleate isomerase/arylmalonate decarboxylase